MIIKSGVFFFVKNEYKYLKMQVFLANIFIQMYFLNANQYLYMI